MFIRENTWQRKDLSVAHHMVERVLERAVDTNPKQVSNQVTELLEMELVNTEDSAGKEDKKKRSQQENQILHLTGKREIVYQPGYPWIKVEVTPIPCFDPPQLWEQQDCREPSSPKLDTSARS